VFDLRPLNRGNEAGSERFRRAFDEMVNQSFLPSNQFQSLKADITEKKDAYLVHVDLPGFSQDDIQVDLDKNQLTIRAKRDDSSEKRDDEDRLIRKERSFGEFVRSFSVENVDQDQVEANLNDGVLKINLPKVKPDDQHSAKRIEIK